MLHEAQESTPHLFTDAYYKDFKAHHCYCLLENFLTIIYCLLQGLDNKAILFTTTDIAAMDKVNRGKSGTVLQGLETYLGLSDKLWKLNFSEHLNIFDGKRQIRLSSLRLEDSSGETVCVISRALFFFFLSFSGKASACLCRHVQRHVGALHGRCKECIFRSCCSRAHGVWQTHPLEKPAEQQEIKQTQMRAVKKGVGGEEKHSESLDWSFYEYNAVTTN